jgi:hypothetical protein
MYFVNKTINFYIVYFQVRYYDCEYYPTIVEQIKLFNNKDTDKLHALEEIVYLVETETRPIRISLNFFQDLITSDNELKFITDFALYKIYIILAMQYVRDIDEATNDLDKNDSKYMLKYVMIKMSLTTSILII